MSCYCQRSLPNSRPRHFHSRPHRSLQKWRQWSRCWKLPERLVYSGRLHCLCRLCLGCLLHPDCTRIIPAQLSTYLERGCDRLKTAFVLGYCACLTFFASMPVSRSIAWGFGIMSTLSNGSCASNTFFGRGVFGARSTI